MTDYKPGTVAVATVCGVPNVRVMWRDAGHGFLAGWWGSAGHAYPAQDKVTDVRPLVVLDQGAGTLRQFAKWLTSNEGESFPHLVCQQIADQIEAQTKPPKPAEPKGLGAVVEDSKGHLWVRAGSAAHVALQNCWRATGGDMVGDWQRFDRIDVVRVLSEGVQS